MGVFSRHGSSRRTARVAGRGAVVLVTAAIAVLTSVGPAGADAGGLGGGSDGVRRVQGAAPAAAASLTSTATVPDGCVVGLTRVLDGQNTGYLATGVGGTLRFRKYGPRFLDIPEPVRAAAYVRSFINAAYFVNQFVLTGDSGAIYVMRDLYDIHTGDWLMRRTARFAKSGWSGVRLVVHADSGYFYTLTDGGGLFRYALSDDGIVRGAGTVAATGWSGLKSLSWAVGGTYRGAPVDGLIGTTSSGALVEYVVRLSDRVPRSFVLARSGWSGFTNVVAGGCPQGDPGRPLLAITPTGDAYAYTDRNGLDLSGGDIRGVGKVGAGFTGLTTG